MGKSADGRTARASAQRVPVYDRAYERFFKHLCGQFAVVACAVMCVCVWVCVSAFITQ